MATRLISQDWVYGVQDVSMTETWVVTNVTTAAAAAASVGYTPGNTAAVVQSPYHSINGICRSVSVKSVADSVGKVWEVTASFGTEQSESAYTAFSSDISGAYVDAWRTASIPSGGTPSGDDIGGTKIDSAGEPVSRFIWQTNMQITRRYGSSGISAAMSSAWSALGKRNSGSFEGAAGGQLLFKGFKVQSIGKCRWEIAYDFVGDEWYHLRQVPKRETDGRVQLSNSSDNPQALLVRWFQPFTATDNFSTLVGSGYSVCSD